VTDEDDGNQRERRIVLADQASLAYRRPGRVSLDHRVLPPVPAAVLRKLLAQAGPAPRETPVPPPVLVYLTTPTYPSRATEGVAVGAVVLGGGLIQWPLDQMSIGGDLVAFDVVQVYFPVEYLGDGQSPAGYHEDMAIAGDLVSFFVGQAFFPVEYLYLRDGQSPSDYHEDMAIAGDLVSFIIAPEYFPVDYLNWPVEFESMAIAGDLVSFTVETAT
jgi:hypothetical protein